MSGAGGAEAGNRVGEAPAEPTSRSAGLLSSAAPAIQWYPGHIAKAEKALSDNLAKVDLVIEVRDARIPLATGHPRLQRWIRGKQHLLVLNRRDMIPTAAREAWDAWFRAAGQPVWWCDAKAGTGVKQLQQAAIRAGAALNARRSGRGMKPRPVRALTLGFPNVGKSALINRLVRQKVVESARRAGVTRSLRWVRLGQDIDLLDAPGVLPPRLDDQLAALHLALCDDIGQAAYDGEAVAMAFVQLLAGLEPVAAAGVPAGLLERRYGVALERLQTEPLQTELWQTERLLTERRHTERRHTEQPAWSAPSGIHAMADAASPMEQSIEWPMARAGEGSSSRVQDSVQVVRNPEQCAEEGLAAEAGPGAAASSVHPADAGPSDAPAPAHAPGAPNAFPAMKPAARPSAPAEVGPSTASAPLPPDAAGWLAAAATRHTSGDTARMAQRLLDDFRRGQLGAIALELPPASGAASRAAVRAAAPAPDPAPDPATASPDP